jgi:hypothetical protein
MPKRNFNHKTMRRITKKIRQIADAHIKARMEDKFDDTPVSDLDELKRNLLDGKTYSELIKSMETEYCSITSILTCTQFNHATDSYKQSIYRGFKELFNKWYN